jgi:hypothetical protein
MNPRRRPWKSTSVAAASALTLLAVLLPVPSLGAGADALVGLRQALDRVKNEGALRKELVRLAPSLGAELDEQEAREGRRQFTLRLAKPLPARSVIAALNLARPYAVSGDPHQESWEIGLWTVDIDDRYGPKIGTHAPHLGAWAVEVNLVDRPQGEMPKLTAGPAPAYDLTVLDAEVAEFQIELWSDWQQLERIETADTPTAPKSALGREEIRAWLERHKGYGAPLEAQAERNDMRVFVAWNIPWSGRNETSFWIYCLQDSGWLLETESTFQPSHDQAHRAVFDDASAEVRFLDADGSVLHRESIAACRWSE